MKREQLIQRLRKYARARQLTWELDKSGGKGSHYRLKLGGTVTTIQSGELTPFHIKRLLDQLKIDPAAF